MQPGVIELPSNDRRRTVGEILTQALRDLKENRPTAAHHATSKKGLEGYEMSEAEAKLAKTIYETATRQVNALCCVGNTPT